MLTQRFDSALCFAAKLHRLQFRKNTEIPYIGHLLGVAALVIDDAGSEDEAIAVSSMIPLKIRVSTIRATALRCAFTSTISLELQ
jgi:(p)ppGpp synthase/HD superfamily hydrolase